MCDTERHQVLDTMAGFVSAVPQAHVAPSIIVIMGILCGLSGLPIKRDPSVW